MTPNKRRNSSLCIVWMNLEIFMNLRSRVGYWNWEDGTWRKFVCFNPPKFVQQKCTCKMLPSCKYVKDFTEVSSHEQMIWNTWSRYVGANNCFTFYILTQKFHLSFTHWGLRHSAVWKTYCKELVAFLWELYSVFTTVCSFLQLLYCVPFLYWTAIYCSNWENTLQTCRACPYTLSRLTIFIGI